jgi:hypothetical protein
VLIKKFFFYDANFTVITHAQCSLVFVAAQQQNLQHLCALTSASRISLMFLVGDCGFQGILSSGMTLFVRRNFPLQIAHLDLRDTVAELSDSLSLESSAAAVAAALDLRRRIGEGMSAVEFDRNVKCGMTSRLRKLGRGHSQKFFNRFVVIIEPNRWSNRTLSLLTFS